ncbi:MAG TPA: DUF4202 family protein [Candidatus Paceibacterota bacterium]|jgi:hypothetical protein|nr:DUF4202 family protein [Candidatus Paceibacterota bacterium]
MNLYEQTVEFVGEAFKGKVAHFERTVFWYEQLLPQLTEAHRVAAYAHDIERALRDKNTPDTENYLDPEFLKRHQEGGAKIMADFLREKGADDMTIDKVSHLISKHEVGGDAEQDALMDADSVSFMETNAEMFVTKKAPTEGYEKVKEKLDWMYNRINSPEAKEAARANYERWSAELEKLK